MKKFITMLLRHWSKTPVKISMTILAVALGTGILILSFSMSSIIKTQISGALSKNGVILYAANGTRGTSGEIEIMRPVEWDADVTTAVTEGTDSVSAAAPVNMTPFDEIKVGDSTYRVRSSVGTSPAYFDVFSLTLEAGVLMTDEDVSSGVKKVWISSSMAVTLFGSASEAIGKTLSPPGMVFMRGPGEGSAQAIILQYVITGVFQDPPEVARRAYGIADLITPWTAGLPGGRNISQMMRQMMGTFVMKADSVSAENTGAAVRKVIAENYGDDTSVTVWEGSLRGESDYLKELRQAITIFTVSVNILGLVLLLISTLGIFSIMVVESLSRRRDIALERAIGASQAIVVREFWIWSVSLSLIGALIGVAFALMLSGPVLGALNPLIGEVSGGIALKTSVTPGSVLGGMALALGCGGILGLLPALTAVRGNIADVLREV